MSAQAYGWDWRAFSGSAEALNWARRDIPCLDSVVSRVRDVAVAVQAGGNLGIFPKRLAQTFGTVFTFEPSPDLFPQLVKNAPETNIIRFQAALGDRRAGVTMRRARRDGKARPPHEGVTHVAGPGVIPTLLVDDLALEHCGLLYLDLEGYEPFALTGAIETIRRCRPVIAVEINHNLTHYGFTAEYLRGWIERFFNYRRVDQQHSDEIFVPIMD